MPSIYPQQPIPIEALSEYDVREILLDGHEILEKPLTPAENFQRIVNQINFSEPPYGTACRKKEEDLRFIRSMPSKLWEAMRETMRMTLIEINALVDILAVIKDGKYLTINPVASEQPEPHIPLYLAGKKRALSAAADILLKGTDRLRRRHTEIHDARIRITNSGFSSHSETSYPSSFHKALMLLRQEWRLKLHQNSILGDVSLRSIGSHFQESGNFEVRESDLFADQIAGIDSSETHNADIMSGVEVIFSRSAEAFLNTAVGSGILNIRFHESAINSGPITLWNSVFNTKCKTVVSDDKRVSHLTQRQRLFKAQRVLACHEILFLLACEACGSRGHDSILKDSIAFATQDEIVATLFPGVQICISMALKPPASADDELIQQESSSEDVTYDCSNTTEFINCLGLQLQRILTAQHRFTWPNLASIPRPVCGPVQVPFYHRAGGANALSASSFTSSNSDQANNSAFSIAVAGVSGFATAAAATWYANYTSKGGLERADTSHGSQRLHPNFTSQDRLSLFTEWGTLQTSGFRPSTNVNVDDLVSGTAGVVMLEQTLFSRGVDDVALKSVIGSNPAVFSRTIAMCRHYYLRSKTHSILSEFGKFSPVKIIIRWDALNSAFSTSVTLCFYNTDYDAYCYWLRLAVTPSGITVNYPDPPRTYCLGTDFCKLKEILTNQVVYTQMQFIEELATKILGWTRLGNNPFSGMINADEVGDGPMVVKIFASPSARHMICIRASVSLGIRLFVTNKLDNDEANCSLLTHEHFREVKLSAVHGKHVVAKIEAIMTVLT